MGQVLDGQFLLSPMLLYSHIINIEFDAIPNEFDDEFFGNLTQKELLILDGVPISAPAQYVLA